MEAGEKPGGRYNGWSTRYTATVFIWVLALSLFITSGRLASGDAGEQYRLAEDIVRSGRLYDDHVPASARESEDALWMPGVDHHLYNAHDPGNTILMLPAAAVRSLRDGGIPASPPNDIARAGVSFTYAVFAAAALTALAYALSYRLGDRRRAFWTLLIFALATSYAAYQKTAWDVLGACLATCLTLGALTRISRAQKPGESWPYIALGATLAATAAFRVTWAPFLAVFAIAWLQLLPGGLRGQRRGLLLAGVTGLVSVAPQLVYNAVRTGNPLKPHTANYAIDRYGGVFSGDILDGIATFLISPQGGLLLYCPLLLLLPLAFTRRDRQPFPKVVGIAAFAAYVLLLAAQPTRPYSTWGARYLIPALPVLLLLLAPQFWGLSTRARRVAVPALIATSLVISITGLFTSWDDDLATWRSGEAYRSSKWSLNRAELTYDSFAAGLTGDRDAHHFSRAAGRDVAARQGFPDLWWAHAIERGVVSAVAAILLALGLLVVIVLGGLRLIRVEPGGRSPPV